jgi:hypothetical protein
MDERDIYLAIEQQFSEGYISTEERDHSIKFAKKYAMAAKE